MYFRSQCPTKGFLSFSGKIFFDGKRVLESWWELSYLANPSGAAGNMLTKTKPISNLLTFSALQIECAASLGSGLMGVMRCDLESSHLMNRWGPQTDKTAMQAEWWKTPWLTPQKIMHQCNIKMATYKVQTTFFSPSFFSETSSLVWCDWLASSKPELPSHLTTSGTGFTAAFWEQSRVPLRTVFGWPLSYVKEQHWKAWCVCLCVSCVCVSLWGEH